MMTTTNAVVIYRLMMYSIKSLAPYKRNKALDVILNPNTINENTIC